MPLKSAEDLPSVNTYYNSATTTHAYLPSFDGNKQLISAILNNSVSQFNFSQYPTLQQNSNDCVLSGTQISYHSPITLDIYDEQGNHVGFNEKGDMENEIPGVAYDIINGNKFAFLPKGHDYKVTGKATGLGHFNVRIQDIESGETVSTAYYNELPIESMKTNVEINFKNGKPDYELKLDQIGDRKNYKKIKPSSMLDAKESKDKSKPETKATMDGNKLKLSATDDNSGILKTQYSFDNGKTWNNYDSNNEINLDNIDQKSIQYRSMDKAGNMEIANEQSISLSENNGFKELSNLKKVKKDKN